MNDAVPEPIFPEVDPYPAYRITQPIQLRQVRTQSPIDEYVLAAMIATGTEVVHRQLPR
jgi:hypothetical protein